MDEERRQDRGLGRLTALSDGVFAIAMTLLVLNLEVPRLEATGSRGSFEAALWSALLAEWPSLLALFISFWVIGLYWVNHHRVMNQLARFDYPLLYLNLLFLFFVAVLPFPTSVLGSYAPATPAVAFYGASVFCVGLTLTLLSSYATRNRLWERTLTRETQRRGLLRGLMTTVVFGASIPVSFIDGNIAMMIWILVAPAVVVVNRLLPEHDP